MSIKQFFVSAIILGLTGTIVWYTGLFILEASTVVQKGDWYFTILLALPQWAVFSILAFGFFLLVFGMGLFLNKIKI